MRDADARDRLDALETALAALPAQVTEVVVAHFEPVIAQVNAAVTAMDNQAKALADIAATVAKVEGSAELLDVIESELNTLRVDVNAGREATTALAKQLEVVTSKLAAAGQAFVNVGLKP